MSTQMQQFTLGDALRKSRTQPEGKRRLSQESMAEQLHVSRPTIGAWEKGETSPPFWAVRAWSQITGWPMEWFEEADDPRSPRIHGPVGSVQLDLFAVAA